MEIYIIIVIVFIWLFAVYFLFKKFLSNNPLKKELEKDRQIDANLRNSGFFDEVYKEIDRKNEYSKK